MVSYNLQIRGFYTDKYSRIYLVYNSLKDSCYFYQPTKIPHFILNKDTNNFIPNEKLLEIIKQSYHKKITWEKFLNKHSIYIKYSSKFNTYVFDIHIYLKINRKGLIKKIRNIVIDAYTGKVLDDFKTEGTAINSKGCFIL